MIPEKLYLRKGSCWLGRLSLHEADDKRTKKDDIEYTRTDDIVKSLKEIITDYKDPIKGINHLITNLKQSGGK